MGTCEILNAIELILSHRSPVAFGTVSEDVKKQLNLLQASGDAAIPQIVSAIKTRAARRAGGVYWWQGAGEVCKMLSQIGTPAAKTALLAILKTDSRTYEFGEVRAIAAQVLATFRDNAVELVPQLQEASKLPHAPLLQIHSAIAALGGQMDLSPELIIEQGRHMQPLDGIRYLGGFLKPAEGWNRDQKRYFFSTFGMQVNKAFAYCGPKLVHPTTSPFAQPYYAAALLADPDPNTIAWDKFEKVERNEINARMLSEKYPLPTTPPIALEIEASSLDEAREQVNYYCSQGFQVVSERIIADGEPETVQAVGNTTEAAFEEAKSLMPPNADVIDKKESVPDPKAFRITVEAFDEHRAISIAESECRQRSSNKVAFLGIRLTNPGARGIFGIGKKPSQYEVHFLEPAAVMVEVTYKRKAKIAVALVNKT